MNYKKMINEDENSDAVKLAQKYFSGYFPKSKIQKWKTIQDIEKGTSDSQFMGFWLEYMKKQNKTLY